VLEELVNEQWEKYGNNPDKVLNKGPTFELKNCYKTNEEII
jgi:hypothetical protein